MPIAHRVDITADNMRDESRRQGYDPEKWYAVEKSDGYWHIQKGVFSVGQLIFEDMAKLLVEKLNEKTK
jgi:hypothetical protein